MIDMAICLDNMDIREARNEEEIIACYPVMQESRPNLTKADFVSKVQSSKNRDGYRLLYIRNKETGHIVSICGFRVGSQLSFSGGSTLYVDDIYTLRSFCGKGHKRALLARARSCSGQCT